MLVFLSTIDTKVLLASIPEDMFDKRILSYFFSAFPFARMRDPVSLGPRMNGSSLEAVC